MFQIGDQVCYPMHGIGYIESIEQQIILGEQQEYYVIRFTSGNVTAMVPVLNADSVGLRQLSDPDKCIQVEEYLREGDIPEESDNWNQRYHDNLQKLRTGDILIEAVVVKCLYRRNKEKGLSTGEKKMYQTARKVLIDELVQITGKDESVYLDLLEDGR